MDLDGDPEVSTLPVLASPDAEDPVQKRIDELCEHFGGLHRGVQISGELLGRISKAISADTGHTVVVLVAFTGDMGNRLMGYALPEQVVVPDRFRGQCDSCRGKGRFRMPTDVVSSGWQACFRCNGTGQKE